MTIRFKDNNPAVEMVSIESELSQLETIIAALECAQVNPEMASLLYGPEISVESFGVKVKDTAKEIWEAIVAFFKKLFNYGKRTEKKAEDVVKETADGSAASVDVPLSIAQQQELVEGALSSPKNIDDVKAALSQVLEKCPDLPASELKALVMGHYRYYGNILTDRDVSGILEALYEETKDYIRYRDHEAIRSLILQIVNDILSVIDPRHTRSDDELVEAVHRIAKQVTHDFTHPAEFYFDRSAFRVNIGHLREDVIKQRKALANWNDVVDNFESNFRYAEENDLVKEKENFKLIVMLAKAIVKYVDINIDYLKAVYEYRSYFAQR